MNGVEQQHKLLVNTIAELTISYFSNMCPVKHAATAKGETFSL
jgi:hypothetical protein